MITIRKAEPGDVWLKTPGQWHPARQSNGDQTATMSCPKCGGSASLSKHSITDGGKVTPSVVCPYDPCDFHDIVVLEGWSEKEDKIENE